jgi:hypothetical protein
LMLLKLVAVIGYNSAREAGQGNRWSTPQGRGREEGPDSIEQGDG